MLSNEQREQIIARVSQEISPKRLAHVLRVEEQALVLANHYGVNTTACQLAALLHDFAKEWSYKQYEQVVKDYQLDETLLAFGSEILHGPVGACVIESVFGISDETVKRAIAVHTSGDVVMDDVAKVLFIADYIEEGRAFEGVDEARKQAKVSLDSAVSFKLKQTISYLVSQNRCVYPKTVEAYNRWINREMEKKIENK